MRPLAHRLIAALLTLAFVVPAAGLCGFGPGRPDPMGGMSCCEKVAPSTSGSVERDCCRMNEQLPEPVPAAPVPPRATAAADTAPALIALPVATVTGDARAQHEFQFTRERPLAPVFLRTTVLLI